MDKRKFGYLLLVAGMMLPLEWATKRLPVVRTAFDIIAGTEMAHVIGHLTMYAGVVFFGFLFFNLRPGWKAAVPAGLVVLALGLGQELLQLQVKGRGFDWPEIFDLWVDLVGAGIGWWLYRYYLRYGRYLRMAYFMLRGAGDHS